MELKKLQEDELTKYIKILVEEYKSELEDKKIGEDYYLGKHDILNKKRTGIGENGKLYTIENLPNTRFVDNKYQKGVDQKIDYILSKPPSVDTKDENYGELLNDFFTDKFQRTLTKVARDTYNFGIGWLYVYLSEDGKELKYEKMDAKEIKPIWKDSSHEKLEGILRLYKYDVFENGEVKEKHEIHLYTHEGVIYFSYENNILKKIEEKSYISTNNRVYSFNKIPFIYFKSPTEESLLKRVKNLQDGLNLLMSNFGDNMLEDPRNTILVIKNYDGQDLGQFRGELARLGAIKVTDADDLRGGVETLEINVNHQNYEAIIAMLKRAIRSNLRVVDFEDIQITSPNELTIQSIYSDMELDANQLEIEFSASFEYLQDFIKQVNRVDDKNYAKIGFERNTMVNNDAKVQILNNSQWLSKETLVANHPLVEDKDEELERIKKEEQEEISTYDDYEKLKGAITNVQP